MKKTLVLAAACTLFAGPLHAQSAPSTADFVKKAAISGLFEVESSRLIEPKADRDTKPFAEQMIKAHTEANNELKSLVQSGKVTAEIPMTLDAEHQRQLDELKGLSGKELDQAYDRIQLRAHQQAVELFTQYSQSGDNPALKQWAAQTLPELKQHLSMAEKLQ
jgi:putative membrane protein